MKYYSEILKKMFDSIDALEEAENELKAADAKKAEAERKARLEREAVEAHIEELAVKADESYKAYKEAETEFENAVAEYNRTYKRPYHFNSKNSEEAVRSLSKELNRLFGIW